ncbi:hypothetical protein CBS101457_005691 [Exobasidium rhododendri]|nr:hypothetical protein CBS101457_005691 [Exobasidium rhododendri]
MVLNGVRTTVEGTITRGRAERERLEREATKNALLPATRYEEERIRNEIIDVLIDVTVRSPYCGASKKTKSSSANAKAKKGRVYGDGGYESEPQR